jgi:hypothetical protein
MIDIHAPESPDSEFLERLPESIPERRVPALGKLLYKIEYMLDGQNRIPDPYWPGQYKIQ